MEIEHIRKEITHLLENIVEHSTRYSDERAIPSLEISFVLTKVNKMQEMMAVLKHLLEEQENASKQLKYAEEPTTTNDIIQEQIDIEESTEPDDKENVTLGDHHEQSPIPKLIDALTLNDRYLYANELFDKDMNAFNDLVKSIDNSSSLDEAREILSKLDWDDDNEQVLSFTNLVERRFI